MVIIAPLLHLVLSWFIIENPEISLIEEIQKDYIIFADMVLLITIPFAFIFWVAVYSLSKESSVLYKTGFNYSYTDNYYAPVFWIAFWEKSFRGVFNSSNYISIFNDRDSRHLAA